MNDANLVQRFAAADNILVQGKAIIAALTTASTKAVDLSTQHYLGGYAVVAICGIYEACIEQMFVIRAQKKGDLSLVSFVRQAMDKSFRNPDYEKIVSVLKWFDPVFATNLKAKVSLQESTALDSIVTQKNAIAHGKPSTVTLGDVENYHLRVKQIFNHLENIVC